MTLQQYFDAVREAQRRLIEELARLEMEFLKSIGGVASQSAAPSATIAPMPVMP
ncbi:MAG: hypothetical protein ACR2FY_15070 [Pirellulaceae bacterium]